MREPSTRPPLKRCPSCGTTMIASKSDPAQLQFDIFTCLSCGSETTIAPLPPLEPNSES